MPNATLRGLAIRVLRLLSTVEDDRRALPISRRSTASQSSLSFHRMTAVRCRLLGAQQRYKPRLSIHATIRPGGMSTRLTRRESFWRATVGSASLPLSLACLRRCHCCRRWSKVRWTSPVRVVVDRRFGWWRWCRRPAW